MRASVIFLSSVRQPLPGLAQPPVSRVCRRPGRSVHCPQSVIRNFAVNVGETSGLSVAGTSLAVNDGRHILEFNRSLFPATVLCFLNEKGSTRGPVPSRIIRRSSAASEPASRLGSTFGTEVSRLTRQSLSRKPNQCHLWADTQRLVTRQAAISGNPCAVRFLRVHGRFSASGASLATMRKFAGSRKSMVGPDSNSIPQGWI